MKKIVNDMRLIYKVCSFYYEQQMSQQEVSDHFGISRTSVMRMLQEGKKRGIVKISVTVTNPSMIGYGEIEKRLESEFGLKDAVVVENNVLDTADDMAAMLFGKAAEYLADFFREGDCVGVSMGTTLHAVAAASRVVPRKKMLRFVPLVGGISQGMDGRENMQGSETARRFAEKFGGTYTTFLAPAVFSDASTLRYFMKEKAINYILEEFRNVNVAVVGIGLPERADHTLLRAGYVTKEEMAEMVGNGAAADISLQFIDENGSTDRFRAYNSRVAAMPLADMKRVSKRIGIARGAERAEAVRAAVRGGYINILITDEACAERLLQDNH